MFDCQSWLVNIFYFVVASKLACFNILLKRVSVFNDDFAKKYPFLNKHNKFSSKVYCWKCHSTLSTGYDGVNDIERHLNTNKYKTADCTASTSKIMITLFKNLAPSKDLEITAAQGVWTFHFIDEKHSFCFMDCTSILVKLCFKPKFHCTRTKSSAIITNIFAAYFFKSAFKTNKLLYNIDWCFKPWW